MKPFPVSFEALALLVLSLLHSPDQTHGFSTRGPTRTFKFNSCTSRCDEGSIIRGHPWDGRCSASTSTALSSTPEPNSNENDSNAAIQTVIDTIKSNPTRSISFSLLMTLCGAALGPFLDSYHSLFGVLSYDSPLTFPILGSFGEGPDLLTCVTTYWVPPLFGVAGFLIGWLYICLDAVFYGNDNDPMSDDANQPQVIEQLHPTIPKVLVGISYFTFQYWLSGTLFSQWDRTSINGLMSVLAAGGFFALDGTLSGLVVSAATAIGGPLIEVGLISNLSDSWAYHYNDLGETGFFPLWILPVYFLGGPANGNLARAFWDVLTDDTPTTTSNRGIMNGKENNAAPSRGSIPCAECQGTRAVPCPNCDDGTYVTYGERVVCNACRGKGRVICRSCFSKYGDDPNDIENIRKIMDQIPD